MREGDYNPKENAKAATPSVAELTPPSSFAALKLAIPSTHYLFASLPFLQQTLRESLLITDV